MHQRDCIEKHFVATNGNTKSHNAAKVTRGSTCKAAKDLLYKNERFLISLVVIINLTNIALLQNNCLPSLIKHFLTPK